jgi:DNA polymerase-3 subunit delta
VNVSLFAIADALSTLPLFSDRRIVVVRNVHNFRPEDLEVFSKSVDGKVDSAVLVLTIVGRIPKVLNDVLKRIEATTMGVNVGTKPAERTEWVEAHLMEAGVSCGADAVRLITQWLGEDMSKLAGLVETLKSTFGPDKKLTRDDVGAFLGEAGGVKPWDLTDEIEAGNTSKALVNLRRMMEGGGSHPLQLLALLANRYGQMLRLDGTSVQTSTDAAQLLGMKEFPARKILEEYRRLGSDGIARALALLAEAEVDLRGGKAWEPEWVMEVLVARLSRLGVQSASVQRRTFSKKR